MGLAWWLRAPALGTDGFHNEDAAGITYSADLLRTGALPYIASHEIKEPGSFFVAWFAWGLFDRSIVTLQRFACFWSILSMLGVYVGGRLLYGARAGAVAALIYAVFSPITDSIDINYHAWMVTPYVWCTVFLIAAEKTGRASWFVASGAMLAVAGLFKRQGALLFPLFVVLLMWAHRLERPDGWAPRPPRGRTLALFAAGLAVGFAPIILYYLFSGGLGAMSTFIGNYFFSEGGWRYVQGELGWDEKLPRLGDGFLGLWEFMAVPSLLTALTLIGARRAGAGTLTWRGVLLGGHFWMSFAGAALGFRFFKGYYIQLLPAAAWIAAHPDGPITRWLRREPWAQGRRLASAATVGCLAAAMVVPALGDVDQLRKIRKERQRARDLEAQRVAKLIREDTRPEDRIWVWGRWGWPVYYHAERLSPTPYYKTLAVVTTNLTNTWRRPTAKTKFVDRGPWREIIAQLEAADPPYIVVSRNEDYSDFAAFKTLLRRDYQRVPFRSGSFTLYRHKDHPSAEKAKPAVRKPRPAKKPAAAGGESTTPPGPGPAPPPTGGPT